MSRVYKQYYIGTTGPFYVDTARLNRDVNYDDPVASATSGIGLDDPLIDEVPVSSAQTAVSRAGAVFDTSEGTADLTAILATLTTINTNLNTLTTDFDNFRLSASATLTLIDQRLTALEEAP